MNSGDFSGAEKKVGMLGYFWCTVFFWHRVASTSTFRVKEGPRSLKTRISQVFVQGADIGQ